MNTTKPARIATLVAIVSQQKIVLGGHHERAKTGIVTTSRSKVDHRGIAVEDLLLETVAEPVVGKNVTRHGSTHGLITHRLPVDGEVIVGHGDQVTRSGDDSLEKTHAISFRVRDQNNVTGLWVGP